MISSLPAVSGFTINPDSSRKNNSSDFYHRLLKINICNPTENPLIALRSNCPHTSFCNHISVRSIGDRLVSGFSKITTQNITLSLKEETLERIFCNNSTELLTIAAQNIAANPSENSSKELSTLIQNCRKKTNDLFPVAEGATPPEPTIIAVSDQILAKSLGCNHLVTTPTEVPINWAEATISHHDISQNRQRKNCFFLSYLAVLSLRQHDARQLMDRLIISDNFNYVGTILMANELENHLVIIILTTNQIMNETDQCQNLLSHSSWWCYFFEKAFLALHIYQGKTLYNLKNQWEEISSEEYYLHSLESGTEESEFEALEARDSMHNYNHLLSMKNVFSPLDFGSVLTVHNAFNLNNIQLSVLSFKDSETLHRLTTLKKDSRAILATKHEDKAKAYLCYGLRPRHMYILIGYGEEVKNDLKRPGVTLLDPYQANGLAFDTLHNTSNPTESELVINAVHKVDGKYKFVPIEQLQNHFLEAYILD